MWVGKLRHRSWLLYLSLYGLALVPYMFVPPGPVLGVYFMVLAWSGVLLVVGRLVLARPAGSGPLWLLAANIAGVATGVLLVVVLDRPTPGPQDVFYMIGTGCGIAATTVLVRRRVRERDRESLLDALVISAGFALLCWVFLIKPAQAAAGSLHAAIVLVSYPVADVFIFALLVRLLLGGGLRNPAMRLIAGGQLAVLVTDCTFAFVPAELAGRPLVFHLMTAVSVSVFAWFGAAALHPGFTRLGVEPTAVRPELPWLRTPLLCGAAATGPALLLVEAWQYRSKVPDAIAIAGGCAVVFSLVVIRMQFLVGRVHAQSAMLGKQAEQLQVLASRDGLTGLVNRRAWDVLLADGLAHAGRTSAATTLAILDLDHFKRYNDSNGHQAGDRLLKAAAAAWAGQLRQVDVLARYGGEEFIVLLPGCDTTTADAIMRRLRAVTPHGQTFSAGIAMWDDGETADQLVARADTALYRAKEAGRDRSVIAPRHGPAAAPAPDIDQLAAGVQPGRGTDR
jgi:diguanylate cyclase (GGDEF)-like protein